MIVKQDLVNKVKDYFDLNVYETKVWLALLSKGIASAGEVADISGVPRSRTYDVLEGLEKRGFAIVKLGKPVKYLGVKPHMILEKLKNNVKTDAEERIKGLIKVKETDEFTQLEALYNDGVDPVKRQDISASIKGKSNISNHLRETIRNAEKEVIVCTNSRELSGKAKIFQQMFATLKKAGVKVNIALSGDKSLISQLEQKLGVKITPISVDAKFFIIDRREIIFYVSKNQDNEDIAIWLNSEFFSQAFATLFDKAVAVK